MILYILFGRETRYARQNTQYNQVKLYNQSEIIASGEVELTVGYVEYNEDGGIGNALQDGINYNYEQIIEVLDEYIQEQSDYVCNEKIVVGVIKGAIEDMC